MVERLPRLQRFAAGVRWLRAADPERLDRVRASVRRYLRLLTLLGASEGDVPAQYRLGPVLRYSLRQLAMLVLVLPVAALGAAFWFTPLMVTRRVAPRFSQKLDQVATYKVGTAVLAFSGWYFGVIGVLFFLSGARATLVGLVALPVAGLAAVAWRDRQVAVREDVRDFLRAWRRSEARDRLKEQRAYLVAEFDALTEAWGADRAQRGAVGEP